MPVTTEPAAMMVRRLGQAGLPVSVIGFGAWGIGGRTDNATSYGATDDTLSLAAVDRALDQGITFFDTAPAYGDGHSEELLGRALAGRRERAVIATKGGLERFGVPADFSPSALRRGLEGSLRRLATGYVDLFQLHNPPPALLEDAGTAELVADLKRAGLIRCFGVSVRRPEDGLEALRGAVRLDSIQVNYNLVDQRARECGLLDAAAEAGTAIIARTPLCFGLLSGRWDAASTFAPDDHRSRWPREQVRLWVEGGRQFAQATAAATGSTPVQLALRFCLSHPAITTTIPGIMSPAEAEENAAAGRAGPLPPDVVAEIARVYDSQSFFLVNDRPPQG